MRQHAASALFVFALASFAAPWFAVTIGGRDLVSFAGTEVAFGTRFSTSSPAAFRGDSQPQFSTLFAAVCGMVGLLTNLLPRTRTTVAPTSAAAGAFAGLIVARVLFPHILMLRSASAVEVHARTGYYLALLLFVAAAIVSAPAIRRGGDASRD